MEERCPDCGASLKYEDIQTRYVYSQCPLCERLLKPPTALGIPGPHPNIDTGSAYTLCMARINDRGKAQSCPRRRKYKSDFCVQHHKYFEKYNELPYGRTDEPYDGLHPIKVDKKSSSEDTVSKNENQIDTTNQTTRDTEMLDVASKFLQNRKMQGSAQTKPITVKEIKNVVDASMGTDISKENGRETWLKDCTEALMSLPDAPLTVLAAAIGPRVETVGAKSCADALNAIVVQEGGGKVLSISKETNLLTLLMNGVDPCPGVEKYLRLRYCMEGVIGQVSLRLNAQTNTLEKDFKLQIHAQASNLSVLQSSYGHPNDTNRIIDVKDRIQGAIDVGSNGKYLHFSGGVSLSDMFGEPCYGLTKVLRLSYVLKPSSGNVTVHEAHGCLMNPIKIFGPVVLPTVEVRLGTLTPKGFMSKKKNPLAGTIFQFERVPVSHSTPNSAITEETINITKYIQSTVDLSGGSSFSITKGGSVMDVVVDYANQFSTHYQKHFGHSEMNFYVEYTSNGKLHKQTLVTDKEFKFLQGLHVESPPSMPAIIIDQATYGHPSDTSLQLNVREVLQDMIRQQGNTKLCIDIHTDMNKLFGSDPCLPHRVHKCLHFAYTIPKQYGQLEFFTDLEGKCTQTIHIGFLQ